MEEMKCFVYAVIYIDGPPQATMHNSHARWQYWSLYQHIAMLHTQLSIIFNTFSILEKWPKYKIVQKIYFWYKEWVTLVAK